MIFETTSPSDLREEDLRGLIDAAVAEGKDVDFKEQLPGGTDREKKEFLADATSFANTIGGWLFYGIKETAGIASSVDGCVVDESDVEMLRLENLIQMGVKPRIPEYQLGAVLLGNGNHVFAIKLRRSFVHPHRVTLGAHAKFYARNSAGKYPMDVSELRTAFTRGQSLAERMKEFRRDRLASIQTRDTPLPLARNAILVLHILPLRAFDTDDVVGMEDVWEQRTAFHPILGASMGSRMNMHGLLTYSAPTRDPRDVLAYSQLYRNGTVEAVSAELLGTGGGDTPPWFDASGVERHVIRAVGEYLEVLKRMGISAPYYIMLSFLGVKGRKIWRRDPLVQRNVKGILEDQLIPPEILADDTEVTVASLLRPALESLWHASGFLGSPSYNEDGSWSPDRRP